MGRVFGSGMMELTVRMYGFGGPGENMLSSVGGVGEVTGFSFREVHTRGTGERVSVAHGCTLHHTANSIVSVEI